MKKFIALIIVFIIMVTLIVHNRLDLLNILAGIGIVCIVMYFWNWDD